METLRRLGCQRRIRGGRGRAGGAGRPCGLQHRDPPGGGRRRSCHRRAPPRPALHPQRPGGAGRGTGTDDRRPHDQRGRVPRPEAAAARRRVCRPGGMGRRPGRRDAESGRRGRRSASLARTVEVHLFGVDADLYGQWVRVEWVERLRDVRAVRLGRGAAGTNSNGTVPRRWTRSPGTRPRWTRVARHTPRQAWSFTSLKTRIGLIVAMVLMLGRSP